MFGQQLKSLTVRRSVMVTNSAAFSAVYVTYGYLSSIILGNILHGMDIHFIRAFLMIILAVRLKNVGGPTLMGFISGVLIFVAPFSSPDKPILPFATIAAGTAYDAALRKGYSNNVVKPIRVLPAASLSGVVEAVVVTVGLTVMGFPFEEAAALLSLFIPKADVYAIWGYLLGRNLVISLVGAIAALNLVKSGRIDIRVGR